MNILPSSSQILHWISDTIKQCRNYLSQNIVDLGHSVVKVKSSLDKTTGKTPVVCAKCNVGPSIKSVRCPENAIGNREEKISVAQQVAIEQSPQRKSILKGPNNSEPVSNKKIVSIATTDRSYIYGPNHCG